MELHIGQNLRIGLGAALASRVLFAAAAAAAAAAAPAVALSAHELDGGASALVDVALALRPAYHDARRAVLAAHQREAIAVHGAKYQRRRRRHRCRVLLLLLLLLPPPLLLPTAIRRGRP